MTPQKERFTRSGDKVVVYGPALGPAGAVVKPVLTDTGCENRMLNIKYMNNTYKFAVNGQTGKVVGEYPIDKGKKWRYFAKIAGFAYIASAVIAYFLLH